VLLRLTYLVMSNALALLRLLPMSDREKDVEILTLGHQLLVLQRQVGKPTFTDIDRTILCSCAWLGRTARGGMWCAAVPTRCPRPG
jgi:putative transposase